MQSRGGGGVLQSCSFDYQCGQQQVCSGNVCVSKTWQCTRNSQCGSNEACLGGTCQALFAQTEPASGYWCNMDAQCTVYETCRNYHCVRCNTGECLNRGSLIPCWHDDQCGVAEICADGLCRTKPCKTDNQCGYTEVCDVASQVCVDCTSQLTNGNGITTTTPNYDTSYYGGYTGSCVGTGSGYWCYADSQCPQNEICDNSKCRSNNPMTPFVCTADAQCGFNRMCYQGLCVPAQGPAGGFGSIGIPPCQGDADCDYNKVCQNGQCIDGGYAPWVPHN